MRLRSFLLKAPVLPDGANTFGMVPGLTLTSARRGEEGSVPPLFDSCLFKPSQPGP